MVDFIEQGLIRIYEVIVFGIYVRNMNFISGNLRNIGHSGNENVRTFT
jgi:hypothetical protein